MVKKLLFGLTFVLALFLAEPVFAYTVEKGDTMTEIAKEHGLTLEQLQKANPEIQDVDLIYVGQVINTIVNQQQQAHSYEQLSGHNDQAATRNISKEDFDLLARLVRAEAQTEPFEGKVAVAAVVLNRVESPKFPDTIREVIYQKRQFQPVSNGAINKPADEESIRAVEAALSHMRDIAGESLFFYNPKIATSRWLDTRTTVMAIGNHVFKI